MPESPLSDGPSPLEQLQDPLLAVGSLPVLTRHEHHRGRLNNPGANSLTPLP